MKYVQLFEGFLNENKQKEIEKAANTWWKQRKKKHDSWEAEDMDMFMDHLMDEGIIDYDDEDLEEVRSDMEQYVENTLGYEYGE
jgi:hypothetical protein